MSENTIASGTIKQFLKVTSQSEVLIRPTAITPDPYSVAILIRLIFFTCYPDPDANF